MKTTRTPLATKAFLAFSILVSALMFGPSLFANHGHNGGGNGGWGNGGNGRQCQVEMQNRRGGLIQTFYARACPAARQQCNRELRRLQRQGRRPFATCVVTRRPGNGGDWGNDGGYRTWTCSASDRGWEEHFRGHKATAATQQRAERQALRECLSEHGSCRVTCSRN